MNDHRISAPTLLKFLNHSKKVWRNRNFHKFGRCPICGVTGPFYAFEREKAPEHLMCLRCRSISRQRKLTRVLMEETGAGNHRSIKRSLKYFKDLNILDTAGMASLSRQIDNQLPKWVRGYTAKDGLVPLGCTKIDMHSLQFEDESFDIVLSDDILEHVQCPQKALSEISRVLKPGGYHLFTMPYSPTKPTITRAEYINGILFNHEPEEYHWDIESTAPVLVYHDFGLGFDEMCDESGLTFERCKEPKSATMYRLGYRWIFKSIKMMEE